MTHIKNIVLILFTLLSYDVFSIEVQYLFDSRYEKFADFASHPFKDRHSYTHAELFADYLNFDKERLKKNNINIFKCEEDLSSDLIIQIRPNFFYNPLMTKMYGQLKINFFTGDNSLIEEQVFEEEISMNFNDYPEKNLLITYKIMFRQVIDHINNFYQTNPINDITGGFCKIIKN